MSTVPKPQPIKIAPKPAAAPKPIVERKPLPQQAFLFDKENYALMIGGVALIFLGFFLMSGGKSANPHEFHFDEIYSVRRITVAPIVLLMGFALEVFAIMKKPKETSSVQ